MLLFLLLLLLPLVALELAPGGNCGDGHSMVVSGGGTSFFLRLWW